MQPEINVYRRKSFFSETFPFSIRHVINRADEFNERKRFRREFWKITYIIRGTGTTLVDEAEFPIHPGSILLVHPGALTTFRMDSEALDLYNIVFGPELIAHELAELQDDFHFFSIFSETFPRPDSASLYIQDAESGIEPLIRSMEREFEQRRSNYQAILKWKLLEILVVLLRQGERARGLRNRDPRRIVEYANNMLEKYYRDDIRPGQLAAQIGVTTNHLCRLYKKHTSETLSQRLRAIRLRHAADALGNSSRSISEICFAAGFNDLSYFYRSFIELHGCNPGEYRKNFGQN